MTRSRVCFWTGSFLDNFLTRLCIYLRLVVCMFFVILQTIDIFVGIETIWVPAAEGLVLSIIHHVDTTAPLNHVVLEPILILVDLFAASIGTWEQFALLVHV